ncbi:MAG: bifunctional metallophosphatase/5'-nucleotidase, partial [Solobacterium sp.]|nr:bifunctional metallophosphatase/5'-nucleotidase [Solobacterium sp.]
MDRYRKLTLLHSNDMHGDFLPHIGTDGKETGGLARLSGYIQDVRRREKNVIYANGGDMFRGSVIDSEYMGLSTIELMNLLSPDVTTVGNHEVDYGLAHLLFLEKCARFPIINANFYVTLNNTRLFRPYINV